VGVEVQGKTRRANHLISSKPKDAGVVQGLVSVGYQRQVSRPDQCSTLNVCAPIDTTSAKTSCVISRIILLLLRRRPMSKPSSWPQAAKDACRGRLAFLGRIGSVLRTLVRSLRVLLLCPYCYLQRGPKNQATSDLRVPEVTGRTLCLR
jgi:hypothetical protein